jgi:hypothetical protein
VLTSRRFDRNNTPHGPRGVLFSPDHPATFDEIAETPYAHTGIEYVDEIACRAAVNLSRRVTPQKTACDATKDR